jgi:type 1 glutamine amidotransferase
MAIIIAHAITLKSYEIHNKVARLDLRYAIYDLDGMFSKDKSNDHHSNLPEIFQGKEKEACWHSVFEMIDEGQLIEGCDSDDEDMFSGWIKIVPGSELEYAIKNILEINERERK